MQLVEGRRQRDQEVQNKLVHHILSQGGQGRDNGGRGVSLADFQNTRPLPFASTPKPMDAEDWLRDTERKVNTVGCSDDEKLRYATYLLSGPAAAWWENLLAIQPLGIGITWTQFKQKFRETHVLDSIMERKRREFENLKQNDSHVMRYVREFSVLSRYATDEVDIEEKRKKRFIKGLHPYMKMQLRLTRPIEFQEFVDAVITLEDDYKIVQEERKKKLWNQRNIY
jgi:hypothetical protein